MLGAAVSRRFVRSIDRACPFESRVPFLFTSAGPVYPIRSIPRIVMMAGMAIGRATLVFYYDRPTRPVISKDGDQLNHETIVRG
jgi:hypothetical protein